MKTWQCPAFSQRWRPLNLCTKFVVNGKQQCAQEAARHCSTVSIAGQEQRAHAAAVPQKHATIIKIGRVTGGAQQWPKYTATIALTHSIQHAHKQFRINIKSSLFF